MSEHRPPTEQRPTSAGAHFPGLDAYRAIGMTMVLLNHAAFATGYVLRGGEVGRIVARFDLAVPMFFVLSGFLLFRPFARAALDGRPSPDVRRFYRSRLLRIIPGYWVAVVGVGVIFDLYPDDAWAWVANLLVLPAFGSHEPYALTQAWSIGVEICFYAALPLLAALLTRGTDASDPTATQRRMLVGTAALFVIGQGFRAAVVLGLEGDPELQARTLLWLPMYLDLFATGMALAVLSARPDVPAPRPAAWTGRHPALCWLGAAAALLLVSRMRAPNAPFGLNGTEYLPRQLAYSAISALWLAPAIFGDQMAGRLRAVLRSRPLTFLGAISLSFYLWHLALVEQAKEWTIEGYDELVTRAASATPGTLETLVTFTGSWPRVAAVAFVASSVVATVCFKLVEVPFQRLKAPRRSTG